MFLDTTMESGAKQKKKKKTVRGEREREREEVAVELFGEGMTG
jgi:predicted HTH domain antitoxin